MKTTLDICHRMVVEQNHCGTYFVSVYDRLPSAKGALRLYRTPDCFTELRAVNLCLDWDLKHKAAIRKAEAP